jgi:hypothetical protein
MTHHICRSSLLAIFLSLILIAFNAQAEPDDYHPTTVEVARLPTFCWGQLGVPDAKGPQFNMPPAGTCGWGMNHYCLGLVDLMRVKTAKDKRGRQNWLWRADANVRYTEGSMKDYPQCPLREHVAGSRAEVDKLMLINGMKPPKTQ